MMRIDLSTFGYRSTYAGMAPNIGAETGRTSPRSGLGGGCSEARTSAGRASGTEQRWPARRRPRPAGALSGGPSRSNVARAVRNMIADLLWVAEPVFRAIPGVS